MIIDDRLLLPFPFYDSLDKQSWRQDKCFGNLKTFQIFTDVRRLPPFQIVTDECSGSCADGTWELYDTTDTLVSDLEVAYDICDFIDVYTGEGRTWYIYDGDILCTDLPTGLHYIKFTVGACEFYSEIFNICPSDSEASLELGPDVYTSWANISFTVFSGSGINIGNADENPLVGDAYARTDAFCGEVGDIFTYSFTPSWSAIGGNLELTIVDATTGLARSNVVTINTEVEHTGQFTTITADGPYKLQLQSINTVDDLSMTCSLKKSIRGIAERVILEYGHTCDDVDAFGYIVYQHGFTNKIIFHDKNDLVKPEYETVKEAVNRNGHVLVTKVITKKAYKMTFYAPEFFVDAIKILPQHDTITITDKKGDSASVVEVDVDISPAGNCFFRVDLTLYVGPLHTSNCCANLDIV